MKEPIEERPSASILSVESPSTMELIYDSELLHLWYDQRGFAHARWVGFLSPSNIKKEALIFLDKAYELGCDKVISDNRLIKGTWLPIVPWIAEVFIPRAIQNGIKKMATISTINTFEERSTQRSHEVNQHFETEAFYDYPSAEKWLLGNPSNNASINDLLDGKITIRVMDRHVVLEFESILFLQAQNKGTIVHCESNDYFTKKPLKDFTKELPGNFFQTHRSYIVNVNYVKSVHQHALHKFHVRLEGLSAIKIPIIEKKVENIEQMLRS